MITRRRLLISAGPALVATPAAALCLAPVTPPADPMERARRA